MNHFTEWSLRAVIVAVCFAFTAALFCTDANAADARPNIVLIMADDLGFSDLGCYGSEIKTPTLDGLAANGIRFSEFYNTAKCHSSRVSLLTGLYCGQAGNESLKRAVTIANVLGEAGYFTAMTGKWHLQKEPTDRGFQRYFGHLSGATNFFTGDGTFRLNGQPWNDFDKDFYTTDAITDYALQFLKEADKTEQPLFMYVAYNAPHYPLQCREEDFRKYENTYTVGWDEIRKNRFAKQKELGLFDMKPELSKRPDYVPSWEKLTDEDKKWESERMAAFAAMVDRLDQNIARLVTYLKETGELDNTLFMFCSDNGACPFERTRGKELRPWDPKSYWCYDTGWAHVGNTPFRWYKQNQHEGGISSPMIAHWPKGITADKGSVTQQPGHLIDFMATAIDVGKAKYPSTFEDREIDPLQGKSLVPIFNGEQREEHKELYFQFSNNRALRMFEWKLVSPRGGPWELYDLSRDRSELQNLADQYPERVKQMSERWFELAKNKDRLSKNNLKPVADKPTGLNPQYRKNLKTDTNKKPKKKK